jgi:hypothetical protein
MALDERSRHDLYLRLEGVLGPEAATTLMEHLPPVGWADVATKRDLEVLLQHMDQRFETMEYKLLATFRGELQTALTAQTSAFATQTATLTTTLSAQTRQLVLTMVGTVVALCALVFAVGRLS